MDYERQRAAYAVGIDGRLREVPYIDQRRGVSVADYLSEVCRTCIGAVYELPKVMSMGKVHGVKHKARKNGHDGGARRNWVERNPKNLGKARKR